MHFFKNRHLFILSTHGGFEDGLQVWLPFDSVGGLCGRFNPDNAVDGLHTGKR